ncbi:MAG: BamA/TamA family outer membrane protein [Fulvivirga sp.]
MIQKTYLSSTNSYRATSIFFGVIFLFASCTISKVTHNESVTQKVIKRNDSTVVVRAGDIYEAGKFKRFILGDHYRDVWHAPVAVPVINLAKAKGGLKILKRGGGMQTFSLKLEAGDGKLYSLRSIQKDPTNALPIGLQYSFVDDILQDQMSASHPYGAFILPPLGDAAGIYHTNPELVYLPDTPQLGKFRNDFGGMLAMLEEDADEDWSGNEDFGNTENAVSTGSVKDAVRDDNDNEVDFKNLLRVRLFDIWVGDWDRHDGQFRWAEFEGKDGDYYRPIPEDRDNVFFKADGVLPWLISRKWALRQFQGFKTDVSDMAGLNFNARHLDRRFLTGLSKSEWIEIARDLQQRLTDEVIESAVKELPDTVYQLSGEDLVTKLKVRRNRLERFALEYYQILARQVDIIGSDKGDYFEVIRKSGGETAVSVYKASDDGEKERRFYHRIFYQEETDELRLYGLKEKDFFYISGEVKDSPLIRIIGGEDEDTFSDSSKVKGLARKTVYYDDEDENDIDEGKETRLSINSNIANNVYDYDAFEYNDLAPALYFGLNSDDGIFFGGGLILTTHGFRKKPYASYQRLVVNYAPKTTAWNLAYEGDFVNVVGDLGINVELFARSPNYFTNFHGFGNETEALVDDDAFYRVRYQEVQFFPGLKLGIGEKTTVKFGPAYQYANVNQNEGRYIDQETGLFRKDFFDPSHFTGFKFDATVSTTDQKNKPEKGIKWQTELQWLGELNNDHSKMSRLQSDLSLYYTLDIPFETTFAVRIGGSGISGDFNFYQASTIGGNAGFSRLGTVRGYNRHRFSGRSSIYQNNEIRMRLLKVPLYYMPFELGISGHFDQGRVWIEGEESDQWHSGIGGGLWIAPLGRWVFTAVYTKGKGEEEGMYNINMGFLF